MGKHVYYVHSRCSSCCKVQILIKLLSHVLYMFIELYPAVSLTVLCLSSIHCCILLPQSFGYGRICTTEKRRILRIKLRIPRED